MANNYKVGDILKYKATIQKQLTDIGHSTNGKSNIITKNTTFIVINGPYKSSVGVEMLYDIKNQQDSGYILKGLNKSDISDIYEKVSDGGGRKLRKSKKNRKSKRNVRKNRKSTRNY